MTEGNGPLPLAQVRVQELKHEIAMLRNKLADERERNAKLLRFEPELLRLQHENNELKAGKLKARTDVST